MGKMVIEVVKPQVSKYEGLKYALEDFELEPAEVMTFGDDYNDIELIRRTEGIAMKTRSNHWLKWPEEKPNIQALRMEWLII